MDPTEKLILLDACCLINLCATGFLREIVAAQPLAVAVVDVVAEESLYIRRGGTGEDADEREPIGIPALLSEGILRQLAPDTDREYERMVDYASAGLDDGEAMTFALAELRGHEVATDDRKACRLADAPGSGLTRHSTVALLQRWVAACRVSPEILRDAVLRIEQRARYRPRHADLAESAWWDGAAGRMP